MKLKTVFLLLATTLLITGCGRNFSGTYTGMQQSTMQNGGIPQQQQVTITLTEGSDDQVSGTWTSGTESGTLQGRSSGTGIESVTLNITQNNTTGNSYYYPSSTCAGVYIGRFDLVANRLTGTLTSQNTGNFNTYCAGTRQVDASKP